MYLTLSFHTGKMIPGKLSGILRAPHEFLAGVLCLLSWACWGQLFHALALKYHLSLLLAAT